MGLSQAELSIGNSTRVVNLDMDRALHEEYSNITGQLRIMKAAYLLDTLGVYSIVQVLQPHGVYITVR